jgi:curli biogenesis system outer membrane secretion channel CsgG
MDSKSVVIIIVLLIFAVCIAGCSSTATQSSTSSQSASSTDDGDRSRILRGIEQNRLSCINNLPRSSSTDECSITSSNQEAATTYIISRIKDIEDKCLATLPRSKSTDECKFSNKDKLDFGYLGYDCYCTAAMNNRGIKIGSGSKCVDFGMHLICSDRTMFVSDPPEIHNTCFLTKY